MKEHAHIEPIINRYNEYKKTLEGIEESKEMLSDKSIDKDFEEMCKAELDELTERKADLEDELKVLLLPKDPMMTKMLLSKSVQAQEEVKLLFLPVIFSECSPAMQNARAGNRRL